MREIEIFYLKGCPYCANARRAVAELLQETPAYSALSLRWIEETEERDLADRYDYYRVPALFHSGDKLYECSPLHGYDAVKAHIQSAFDRVMG